MNFGKIIGFVSAAIVILFGVLFLLAAFSSENQSSTFGTLLTGGILLLVGFAILWFVGKIGQKSTAPPDQNITLQVDLPGDVNIERFKCQDCGSQLSMDNVKMVAGAPMVNCPYCDAAYQLTEEPKW
ncbi:MAG: hypothetical protein HON98_13035 [Chloroflexi bacterium]|jgi:hypothetical protein|nr:hypothetical protein [Chloroflexota bacterium]MBT4003350.1 hypothetical protein [Chloroflexota bacterium]MBT4305882.1 hypothetical protein [Chloroflexota bacterium]MBT4533707.1 hypothetical protein [Chloroflexota bacterium]MBT4681650.1 hypothetical protein [Chloroflexota bacterium]